MNHASSNNRIRPLGDADSPTPEVMAGRDGTEGAGAGPPAIERIPVEDARVGADGATSVPREVVGGDGNRLGTSATPAPAIAPVPPADPFDPANLRLSQDFLSTGGVKKHITTVPARKPTREEWLQVNASPAYALDTLVLELKDSRECYLIAPALQGELATEPTVTPRRLHLAVNRDGTPFIWPLRLPPADGRQDRWSESALEAAEAAKDNWVRLQADMGLGAYVYFTPLGELPPPQWPDMPFAQLLRLAFRSNFIETRDHVVLRRLRGEV